MILNEEGGDHILISNDLSFTDKIKEVESNIVSPLPAT